MSGFKSQHIRPIAYRQEGMNPTFPTAASPSSTSFTLLLGLGGAAAASVIVWVQQNENDGVAKAVGRFQNRVSNLAVRRRNPRLSVQTGLAQALR